MTLSLLLLMTSDCKKNFKNRLCFSYAGAEGCGMAEWLQNCQTAAETAVVTSGYKNNFSYLKMTLLMEWNVVNGWMDEKK